MHARIIRCQCGTMLRVSVVRKYITLMYGVALHAAGYEQIIRLISRD